MRRAAQTTMIRHILFAVMCVPLCASAAGVVVGPADFVPVLAPAPGQSSVHVAEFRLDTQPVTNAQFLEFVQGQPQWRRDRVPSLFADQDYLSHWSSPDSLGEGALPDQPITRVSWFAARAYCAARGQRLPDWYEWELAAAADEHVADARADPIWRNRILDWYARPATDPLRAVGTGPPNVHGVQDLHGLIWEWVEDYGSLMVSVDSRDQGDPDKLEFCGAGALSAQDRENYPVLMRIAFLSALEGRSSARRLGFRCAQAPEVHSAASSRTAYTASTTTERPAAGAPPGDSLYQLPLTLEGSDGKSMALSSFRGKPLIITMFYGSCTSVCPIVTNQLQVLERRLAPKARAGIRTLMVSLDHINDTPAQLQEFRQHHQINDPRWVVARTDADGVRLLAAALKVRYRRLPDQSFNHSTTIAVANSEGVIQAQTSGVQASDAGLVNAANSMFAATRATRLDGASTRHRQ